MLFHREKRSFRSGQGKGTDSEICQIEMLKHGSSLVCVFKTHHKQAYLKTV